MDNIILKEGVTIRPFMENVIIEIARKHPDWSLECNQQPEAFSFRVHHTDTKQLLGRIGMTRKYKRGERIDLFELDNWRITEARQRGSTFNTTKPKEALKAVEKYFYPPTQKEVMTATYREAHHHVYSITLETRNELERCFRTLQQPMATFAHAHWDMFLNSLDDDVKAQALQLSEKQETHNTTTNFFREVDTQNVLTVLLTDGKYTVEGKGTTEIYESDALPEDIKTKVGLLKLVDDKQVVPEVGVRISNVFFIRK